MTDRSLFFSVLLAFLVGTALAACTSPTVPRIPQPDEDPEEPDPGQGEEFSLHSPAAYVTFLV